MSKKSMCVMSTLLVGGTHRHYEEMAVVYSISIKVILVEYDKHFLAFSIYDKGKLLSKEIHLCDSIVSFLANQFSYHNVIFIHLHHMICMSDDLYAFLMGGKYKLAVTLHDYYTICPKITMMKENLFCGEAKEMICNECICNFSEDGFCISNLIADRFNKIAIWRNYWLLFLEKADYVFVPSSDQRERLLKYFPSLTKIRVIENPEIVLPCDKCDVKLRKIGVLGTISEAKGRSVLLSCARLAEKRHFNIQFVLFGNLSPVELNLPSNLIVKGKYKENEIYNLIKSEDIDFFWFTAIWPETYSYVLTIPIRLGIPVIAADLGAIAERIKRGGWGTVYPLKAEFIEIVHALDAFDYEYYRNTGDFNIENDHFLSFQEIYCNDKKIFSKYSSYKGEDWQILVNKCVSELIYTKKTDVKICGCPSKLEPRELKYLWNKNATIMWKFRLLIGTDKIVVLKKVIKKIYRKMCVFLCLW